MLRIEFMCSRFYEFIGSTSNQLVSSRKIVIQLFCLFYYFLFGIKKNVYNFRETQVVQLLSKNIQKCRQKKLSCKGVKVLVQPILSKQRRLKGIPLRSKGKPNTTPLIFGMFSIRSLLHCHAYVMLAAFIHSIVVISAKIGQLAA